MREQDLKDIPQYMTRADRDRLLAACGITELKQVVTLEMSYRGVTAEVLATDERGRTILEGHDLARHQIFIPVVDRAPEVAGQEVLPDEVGCGERGGRFETLCRLPGGHEGLHSWDRCPVKGCAAQREHDGEHLRS